MLRVAAQQYLREVGFTYREVAEISGVHPRTIWQHCAAHYGSHVTPWHERGEEERQLAAEIAWDMLVRYCQRSVGKYV